MRLVPGLVFIMITLYKLMKLPYAQGMRKTAKIFEEAERRFTVKKYISIEETVYLSDILHYWIAQVPAKPGKALGLILENLKNSEPDTDIRRSLNDVQFIFRSETGLYPADWDFDASDLSGELDAARRKVFAGMEIYLEDIRSPFNVGAIFRCAESFGIEKIYLSPFCADPNHTRANRTAMGCISIMPWLRLENDPWANNREEAWQFPPKTAFFALETGGTNLDEFSFPDKGIMIIGSEELGVSPAALAKADSSLGRVSIPVMGSKGSLNVSVAFGIVVHAWAAALQKSGKK